MGGGWEGLGGGGRGGGGREIPKQTPVGSHRRSLEAHHASMHMDVN